MAEKSKVTRITAKDDAPKAKSSKVATAKSAKTVKAKRVKQSRTKGESKNYFVGAWQELKLVRWPTRKATWGLTVAVILFSLAFVALILLLDGGFNYLFELIIGK